MNKSNDFENEHKYIINEIGRINNQAEFISFFFSSEYLNYMTKLKESDDKEKMSECEAVKNKKTNELFKK